MPGEHIASQLVTCPNIADGNPWYLYSIAGLAELHGIPINTVLLNGLSTRAVGAVHGAMSRIPRLAEQYTQDSESRRAGKAAQVYSRLVFGDMVSHANRLELEPPARWIATQEHPVLGSDADTLRELGIVDVDLLVADSSPKESGVQAVLDHDYASMYVWNTDAYEELASRGVDVELIRPTLIEGITRMPMLLPGGSAVVAKTSGSGMKHAWVSMLVNGLTRAWRELSAEFDYDWMLQTPKQTYDSLGFDQMLSNRRRRIQGFCGSIGLDTSLVIGFPTELTMAVAEMRSKGAPVQLLACPPRGEHEANNLRFARRHGLLFGEIDFTGNHEPTITGAKRVPIRDLTSVVREAITSDYEPLPADVLGDVGYFEHETVRASAV